MPISDARFLDLFNSAQTNLEWNEFTLKCLLNEETNPICLFLPVEKL